METVQSTPEVKGCTGGGTPTSSLCHGVSKLVITSPDQMSQAEREELLRAKTLEFGSGEITPTQHEDTPVEGAKGEVAAAPSPHPNSDKTALVPTAPPPQETEPREPLGKQVSSKTAALSSKQANDDQAGEHVFWEFIFSTKVERKSMYADGSYWKLLGRILNGFWPKDSGALQAEQEGRC